MGVIKQHKVTPAVLPAALCAASRKRSRKPRIFSNVKSTLEGGPLLGIARPTWLKVVESERRIAWMTEMLRKKLIVKDLEAVASNMNEKLRTDLMRMREEERSVLLGLMKVKLKDERKYLFTLKRKKEDMRKSIRDEVGGKNRKLKTMMKKLKKV